MLNPNAKSYEPIYDRKMVKHHKTSRPRLHRRRPATQLSINMKELEKELEKLMNFSRKLRRVRRVRKGSRKMRKGSKRS